MKQKMVVWLKKWGLTLVVLGIVGFLVGDRIYASVAKNRPKARKSSPTVMMPMPDQPTVPSDPTDEERIRAADVWIGAAEDLANEADDAEAKEVAATLHEHRDILKPTEKGIELIKPAPQPVKGWSPITSLFPSDQVKSSSWAVMVAMEDPVTFNTDYGTIVVKGAYPIDNRLRGLLILKIAHMSKYQSMKPPEDPILFVRSMMPSNQFSLRLIRKLGGTVFDDLVAKGVAIVRSDARARGYLPGSGAPETFEPPSQIFDTPFPARIQIEQRLRVTEYFIAVFLQWIDEDFKGSPSEKEEAQARMIVEVVSRVNGLGSTLIDAGAPPSPGIPM